MPRKVLILQHVAHETGGTLDDYLQRAGLDWSYLPLYRNMPDRIDWASVAGLVVLGGSMNVDETDRYPFLKFDLRAIGEALDAEVPLLGVCLGSQLLAKALGSRVYPNGVKEIGWYALDIRPEAADDPLFTGCGPQETVFQWHGDTFDLPGGAVHLASSRQCAQQAFRYGRSAWGIQFHIEMTRELIDSWLGVSENDAELASLPYIDPARIRAETPAQLPRMASLADRVLSRFAAMCRRCATA